MLKQKVTAAVRINEDGKEFIDPSSICFGDGSAAIDIVINNINKLSIEIPMYHHDNPVLRISTFILDEIEQVS